MQRARISSRTNGDESKLPNFKITNKFFDLSMRPGGHVKLSRCFAFSWPNIYVDAEWYRTCTWMNFELSHIFTLNLKHLLHQIKSCLSFLNLASGDDGYYSIDAITIRLPW
jgi:hypothetical protein